jgi:hypothetical protein
MGILNSDRRNAGYTLPTDDEEEAHQSQQHQNDGRRRFPLCLRACCYLLLAACFTIVVIILIVVFLLPSISQRQSPISYQVHSYNDLDSLEVLLQKGVEWMKYDIHYVNASACLSLPFDYNCSSEGIFLLAHDDPTEKPDIEYFTADELLERLANTHNNNLHSLKIALCGKNTAQDRNITYSNNYLNLADQFMAKVIHLQQQQANTTMEFILDGFFAPVEGYLQDRWQPLLSTWSSNRAPPSAYFNNNHQNGNDRFQIFNVGVEQPARDFLPHVVSNYGKFSNIPNYPYLVWEPSDQEIIRQVSNMYRDGIPHMREGLRFAINISPERFQVFNAEYSTNAAWNYRIPQTKTLSRPVCFVLDTNSNSKKHIVCFAWNETRFMVEVLTLHYSSWFGQIQKSQESTFIEPGLLKNLQSAQQVNETHLVVCDDACSCAIYGTVTMAVSAVTECQLSSKESSSLFFAAMQQQSHHDDSSSSLDWMILSRNDDCGLLLDDHTCLTGMQVDSAAFGHLADNSTLFVAWATSNRSLYYVLVDPTAEHDNNKLSPVRFGVGSSVSVSTYNGTILVTSSDSFCWNTEYQNKEIVRFCSSEPVSTNGVLSYYVGEAKSWRSNQGIISSCNAEIWTGSFDEGSESAATLYYDGKELRILEVHVGASSTNQDPTCGLAMEYDGLVIDSWDLQGKGANTVATRSSFRTWKIMAMGLVLAVTALSLGMHFVSRCRARKQARLPISE